MNRIDNTELDHLIKLEHGGRSGKALLDLRDLRAESERLSRTQDISMNMIMDYQNIIIVQSSQLAAQQAVIEAAKHKAAYYEDQYKACVSTKVGEYFGEIYKILATLNKGTSTPSATMEPDK